MNRGTKARRARRQTKGRGTGSAQHPRSSFRLCPQSLIPSDSPSCPLPSALRQLFTIVELLIAMAVIAILAGI